MIRFVKQVLAGALLLYIVPLPAVGQGNPDDVAKEQIRAQLQQAEATSARSENGAVDAAPLKSDVSIVASKDSSTAKITVGHGLSGGRLIGTLSTPISKKDDATQFFSLDGPAEDLQLGIAWKRQSFGNALIDKIDFVELQRRRDNLCQQHNVRPCDDTSLEAALEKEGKSRAEIARTLEDFFSVKVQGETRPLPLFRAIPISYLNFAGSLGRTERKFFDLTGSKKEDDRLSYAMAVTYGRVFPSSRWTATFGSQRKYKETDKAQKCTPAEGSTLNQCEELPLGEAKKVDSAPLTFEYRVWFGRSAISPKAVYDFQRKVFSGSLPIYLFADSDKKLTGGIRLDLEEGKKPSASVFVSSPLGLD